MSRLVKSFFKMCLTALIFFACTPDSTLEKEVLATIVATSDSPEELAYELQEQGFIEFAEPRMNPADNDDVFQAPPPCPGGGPVTDADGDGWTTGCGRRGGDCNDGDATINPAAEEHCDGSGVDRNCNGDGTTADPTIVDAEFHAVDLDRDGTGGVNTMFLSCSMTYASPTIVEIVNAPAWIDCDDSTVSRFPLNIERVNGIDDNCDPRGAIDDHAGLMACFEDVDGDGYGRGAAQWTASAICPAGQVRNPKDCNDGDASINPLARELCDGVDRDCDGVLNNSQVRYQNWYLDSDGDGYGSGPQKTYGVWYPVCIQNQSGYVGNNSDRYPTDSTRW